MKLLQMTSLLQEEATPTVKYFGWVCEKGVGDFLGSDLSFYILKSYMDSIEFSHKVVAVTFNRMIRPYDTPEEMARLAIRPANLRELIAFGGSHIRGWYSENTGKYSGELGYNGIVACGTPMRVAGKCDKYWSYYFQDKSYLNVKEPGRPASKRRKPWFLGVPLDDRHKQRRWE